MRFLDSYKQQQAAISDNLLFFFDSEPQNNKSILPLSSMLRILSATYPEYPSERVHSWQISC